MQYRIFFVESCPWVCLDLHQEPWKYGMNGLLIFRNTFSNTHRDGYLLRMTSETVRILFLNIRSDGIEPAYVNRFPPLMAGSSGKLFPNLFLFVISLNLGFLHIHIMYNIIHQCTYLKILTLHPEFDRCNHE